jgi:hypothetical protein
VVFVVGQLLGERYDDDDDDDDDDNAREIEREWRRSRDHG